MGDKIKEIKKYVIAVLALILLQFLIDSIYVYIYPQVNPIRATLIGLTALVALFIPYLKRIAGLRPALGFLPIYSSALFGALLVQNGYLVSKSLLSGAVHVAILLVTYAIIIFLRNKYAEKQK